MIVTLVVPVISNTNPMLPQFTTPSVLSIVDAPDGWVDIGGGSKYRIISLNIEADDIATLQANPAHGTGAFLIGPNVNPRGKLRASERTAIMTKLVAAGLPQATVTAAFANVVTRNDTVAAVAKLLP